MQKQLETRIGVFVLVAIALFFYISFQIGSFRFNRSQYHTYRVHFKDISGISHKSQVKIAGVEVGWVETINLCSGDVQMAQAHITVRKEYTLTTDAYAIIRQDGMLGPYYLEIIPGNPLLPALEPGTLLQKASKEPIPIDTMVEKYTTLADTIEGVSNHVHTNLLPLFQNSVERIASVFDRDFGPVAERLGKTTRLLDQASQEAHYGLKTACDIADKVDKGEGFIGKLVNDTETYDDLKYAIQGIRNYISKLNRLSVIFDSHAEYSFHPTEHYGTHEDSKMYFTLSVHPSEQYFCLAQLISIEQSYEALKRYHFKIGAQVAKRFDTITFRLGIFEGLAGVAVDFDIPFPTNTFRWITTFEAGNLRNWNRTDDHRIHAKWLNRIFACNNIYLNFGANDFVSRRNVNFFFGLGLRFGDSSMNLSLAGLSNIIGSSHNAHEKMVEGVIIS